VALTFDIFMVASGIVTDATGRIGFVGPDEVAMPLPGVAEAMLLLRADESDGEHHVIGFGLEGPTGAHVPVASGDPDRTPRWVREQICFETVPVSPGTDLAPLVCVWERGLLRMFPVGLRLAEPGEHRVFVSLDGVRELSRAIQVRGE